MLMYVLLINVNVRVLLKLFFLQYDITKRQLYKNTLHLFPYKLNKNYKPLYSLTHTSTRLEKPKTFNVKIQTRSGKFFRFTLAAVGEISTKLSREILR